MECHEPTTPWVAFSVSVTTSRVAAAKRWRHIATLVVGSATSGIDRYSIVCEGDATLSSTTLPPPGNTTLLGEDISCEYRLYLTNGFINNPPGPEGADAYVGGLRRRRPS